MMHPLSQTLCCVAGLAAAGVPLLYFTAPAPAPAPTAPPAAAETQGVPVTLRCSGQPQQVRLWQGGRQVCELSPQGGLWQGELTLENGPLVELEVEATWPTEGRCGAECITIELTPPHRSPRQDTQWTQPPNEGVLHGVFVFTW